MTPQAARAGAKAIIGALSAIVLAGLTITRADASDPVVDQMGNTFMSQLPSGWAATKGGWDYVDVAECFASAGNCFGNNPSSQYGSPTLPSGQGPTSVLKFTPNQALIVFMKTPPAMRYFSFSQYLFSRNRMTYPLFASVSDSLNNLQFLTNASSTPGQNVFDQYAVVVWTADLNTLASIKTTLAKQGIPGDRVNFIPLPINLPLFMGTGSTNDAFVLMMRTAIPDVQSKLDAYLQSAPFFVIKTGPASSTPVNAAPTIGYRSETSGITEDTALRTSLYRLQNDVRARYGAQYNLTDLPVAVTSITGWDCIKRNMTCNADTHDSLYSKSGTVQVSRNNDLVIVVGVNHKKLNKALYINHVVNDATRKTGIVAVDDRAFTSQSALYHAGVTSPTDSRVPLYQDLYAYAISYDCTGIQFCLQIPAPTPQNPVGLTPGTPFAVSGRAYVEPHTQVRPLVQEIYMHKAMIARRK